MSGTRALADDELTAAMPRYSAIIDAADQSGLDFDAPSLSLSACLPVPVALSGAFRGQARPSGR